MKRIVAGPNAVFEILAASPERIDVIYIFDGLKHSMLKRLLDTANDKQVTIETAHKETLDKLAPKLNHQGVVALTGDYPYKDLSSILDRLAKATSALLLLLDQIQDPGNLGAILRTAHALGVDGVIITKDKSASITPGAARASTGACELIDITRVTNLSRCIELLKRKGFMCYGAAGEAQTPLCDINWTGRTALVMGNEGKGLRRLTKERCDLLFKIPMSTSFDSLNVSAAAAISLYEASRQRPA